MNLVLEKALVVGCVFRHDDAVKWGQVAAIGLAGVAVVGTPTSASSSPAPGGALYVSYSSGAPVQVISPDGSSVADAFPIGVHSVTFTPAGTGVAYVQGGTILSGPGDGRDSTLAGPTAGSDLNPTWPTPSPDGTQIAFSTSTYAGLVHIGVMSADGTAVRALTAPTVFESYPEWSPTSDTILFTRQTGGHIALETVDLNGATHELTGANTQSWQGSWSPDGSKIAFVRGGAGGGPSRTIT